MHTKELQYHQSNTSIVMSPLTQDHTHHYQQTTPMRPKASRRKTSYAASINTFEEMRAGQGKERKERKGKGKVKEKSNKNNNKKYCSSHNGEQSRTISNLEQNLAILDGNGFEK